MFCDLGKAAIHVQGRQGMICWFEGVHPDIKKADTTVAYVINAMTGEYGYTTDYISKENKNNPEDDELIGVDFYAMDRDNPQQTPVNVLHYVDQSRVFASIKTIRRYETAIEEITTALRMSAVASIVSNRSQDPPSPQQGNGPTGDEWKG
jgi:hypothetical protein